MDLYEAPRARTNAQSHPTNAPEDDDCRDQHKTAPWRPSGTRLAPFPPTHPFRSDWSPVETQFWSVQATKRFTVSGRGWLPREPAFELSPKMPRRLLRQHGRPSQRWLDISFVNMNRVMNRPIRRTRPPRACTRGWIQSFAKLRCSTDHDR